jgi:hypothetical protein
MQEVDFSGEDPGIGGCLRAEIKDGWAGLAVLVRSSLDAEQKASFAEWAESRINRLLESGPQPDGWQQQPDGIWQLCARQMTLPSLD